jgi:hypothetical protein
MERKVPPPFFFPLIFLIIVFISTLGLDYISWKKGEKSYLFASFPKREKTVAKKLVSEGEEKKVAFDQMVMDRLSQLGISPDSINQSEDSEGISHLLIDLDFERYRELESSLEKDLRSVKASVDKKEEKKTDEKNYFLWEIKGKKKQKIILLFSCLKKKKEEKKPSVVAAKGKVAIIIDDMGYSLNAIREIISMEKPLTIAVLPFSPLAKETAQIAHQNGLEIMLHLPLEAISNQEGNDGTEGMIHSEMSRAEVIGAVARSLKQVPHISGVNNHMGSKITTDVTFMRIILNRLRERDLFFIDSRTTSDSVAYEVAQIMGIPSAYRNIFLDIETNEEYIKGKLIELFELVQKKGQALAICHPTPQTLKVLKENLHLMEKYNLEPVFASQVVQ